jgi:hypothetical protein
MVSHSREIQSTLRQRVSHYLTGTTRKDNAFVAKSKAAEAEASKLIEAEMTEYRLQRAIQELRTAQKKVDNLRKQLEEQRKLV